MLGIRKQISLLLDHGHPDAWQYPLHMVFAEARRVTRRIDVHLASQTALLNMALSAQPNMNVKQAGTAKIAKALDKVLKDMLDGQ